MSHLDEGALQGWIHGERGANEAAIARHLGECTVCQAAVARVEAEDRWIRDRLAVLDVSPPSRLRVVAPPVRGIHSWRRAAAILLVAGIAGVAAATPAVRRWVATLASPREARSRKEASERPATVRPVAPVEAAPGGIAVMPGERFGVAVIGGDSVAVRLRGVGRGDLAVSTTEESAGFESREREIVVRVAGGARVDVEVPMGAAFVELTLNGQRLAEVHRGVVRQAGRPDEAMSAGAWIDLRSQRP